MSGRGRRAKPTAVKRLTGNPGKRPLNGREPMPDGGMPSCPGWLSEVGKRQWRRVARALHDAGLLTKVDGLALALLCDAYGRFMEARAMVAHEGLVCESEKGGMYQHPAVGIMNRAWGDVVKLMREFGMTPSSRGGIKLPVGDDEEPTLADALFSVVEFMENGGGNE